VIRVASIAVVALAAACGGGDGPAADLPVDEDRTVVTVEDFTEEEVRDIIEDQDEGKSFVETWASDDAKPIPGTTAVVDGHMVFANTCEEAKRLTSGGRYDGYGYFCPDL
jgi:hypothetical protein